MRLWRGVVAATAIALSFGLLLHLTGVLMPWAVRVGLVRIPPPPPLAAVRNALSQLAGRTNVASGDAEDLAAATAFYEAHNGPLLWVAERGFSERGNSVINEIRKADDWGLRATDFALPRLPAGPVSPDAAARAEMALTFAVLKYARYARGGRFGNLSNISKVLDYPLPVHRPGEVLNEIAASHAPDDYLRSLHPKHEQFEALRRLLLKLRGSHATASFGENQDRTVLLARVLVNMERWRWLPADLGGFYVWNNVPEFATRVVRKGEIIHSDRIVAGQPDWPTPAFSADMKMIVFHPSWGVPDGIRRKELLPRLRDRSQGGLLALFGGTQSTRSLLEEYQLQVTYQGRPVDPDKVDWSTANIGAYEFRQPPGPKNPLGLIKFMFPNKHDVYMHDTPATERDLFARPYRGLSHGCMRVADPLRLATLLLAQDRGWSEQQVASLLNGGTYEVKLATRIPVHMTYFTVLVDPQGNVRTFGDLYGLDTRMGEILFGTNVPFVTPNYDDEIAAMRERYVASAPSGTPSIANAIANIFSP
ncbi:MAG: L,D-transpeptidase family protein [Hyphomicrobiaceae bacterium]|nr:L,D-transpeptidase family protein [Hyphomicrobiaceae bacterium]